MHMAGQAIRATLERLRNPIHRHSVVHMIRRNRPEYCDRITIERELCLCSPGPSITSDKGTSAQETEGSGLQSVLKRVIVRPLYLVKNPVRGRGQIGDGRTGIIYCRRRYRCATDKGSIYHACRWCEKRT
jgi:hypothetical protein